jgi:hypothetical protein
MSRSSHPEVPTGRPGAEGGERVLLLRPRQAGSVDAEGVVLTAVEHGLVLRRAGAGRMTQAQVRRVVAVVGHRDARPGGTVAGIEPEAQAVPAAGDDGPGVLTAQAAQHRDRGRVIGQDEPVHGRQRESTERQVQAGQAGLPCDAAALRPRVHGEADIHPVPGPVAQAHPPEEVTRRRVPDREIAVAVPLPVGDVVVTHGVGRRPAGRPPGRQPPHHAVPAHHGLVQIPAVPAPHRLHHEPSRAQDEST